MGYAAIQVSYRLHQSIRFAVPIPQPIFWSGDTCGPWPRRGPPEQAAMPLSGTYVVQHLVQGTVAGELQWGEDNDSGGHAARLNGVLVEFVRLQSSTESRLWLSLSCTFDKVHIPEPRRHGFLGSRYANDDDRQLAERLQELEVAVARQCAQRKQVSAQSATALRQAMFHRLVFGPAAASRAAATGRRADASFE